MAETGKSEESPKSSDPFEVWRQAYEVNEQIWTKTMKEAMGTQAFAEASSKMLETFLSFQKIMREGVTAQLASLNLPTRDDVARLGELIVRLEEKVDQLDEGLVDLEDRVDELHSRLGEVLDRLESRDGGATGAGQPPATGAATSAPPATRSSARAKRAPKDGTATGAP